jgi:hypothetical protein
VSLIAATNTLPCQTDPDAFQAPDGERRNGPEAAERIQSAKALCGTCPVLVSCRDLGRRLRVVGVWGGETDEERTDAGYKPAPKTYNQLYPDCGSPAAAARHRRDGGKPCTSCLTAETANNRNRKAKYRAAA